jgi:hypothetical protein
MFVTLKKSFEFCAVVLGLFGFYANSAQATDHWHYITPATCTPRHGNESHVSYMDGVMNFRGTSLMCPVYLPQGATLISFRAYSYATASNELYFGMTRKHYSTPGSSTQIVAQFGSGSYTGSAQWYQSSGVSVTIDNENNSYLLYVDSAGYTGNNDYVSMIEIYYTTP